MRHLLALIVLLATACAPAARPELGHGVGALTAAPPPLAGCAIAELDSVDPSAVLLSPASYPTWAAMLAANPAAVDYLLQPGDYTGWGVLTLQARDGLAGRKRTIRYYDPSSPAAHPLSRSKAARIDGFKVFHAQHWLIAGLTQLAPTAANDISQQSADIVLDSLLIEAPKVYGVRVRTGNVCIQRSVIRRPAKVAHTDSVGIQIQPLGYPLSGVEVLRNEVSDMVDAVQVTDDAADPFRPTSVRIEGNDLYTSPAYAHCTENGIDIKAGSESTETLIARNRIWGYVGADIACAGSGGRGDAIMLHRAARNLRIEANLLSDNRNGIAVAYWPADWPDQQAPRHVAIAGNELRGNTSAFDLMMDAEVTGNTVALGQYLCDTGGDSGARAGGPSFRDNTLVSIGAILTPGDAHPCPFVAAVNQERAPVVVSQQLGRPWAE